MRGQARLLAGLAALALVLGPALAEARPGGGMSSGSRGSRTYSPPPVTRTAPEGARPMERTTAPQPQAARPGMATPAPARSGMFGGFGGAMLGGLIGVGLGGMLFGNGLFGGISGLGGVLGLLLQIGLVVLLVRFALRFFRSRQQPAMAGGPALNTLHREAQQPEARPMPAGGVRSGPPLQVTPADFQGFETMLYDVNAAWSRRDEAALNRLTTPEMAGFFAQDLRDLDARGWRNETRDVKLEQGDLAEGWSENGTDYATVAMRFSLIDITVDAQGQVVEGSADKRSQAMEHWTFRRLRNGPWQLAAIQQPG